jgi:DNA-3-methyladenine glycosylase II
MPSSHNNAAVAYLAQADPVMGRLIDDIGPCVLTPRTARSPFESLARAIAFQQLHEKAAESIVKRFIALFPGRRFPRPEDVLATEAAAIRGAGFSTAKALALRDLAAKTLDGTVPPARTIRTLDDFGVRNGFRIAYRKRAMPTPAQVRRHGERWKPYRTTAAWYLWRAADRATRDSAVL